MSNQGDAELSPLKRALIEIRELRQRQAAAEQAEREPIAVVGMGLRFPGGADDPEGFWELLWNGVDAIREVPADRWSADELYDEDPDTPGKMNTRWGGFLDDVDRFDAGFFGISRREAESLDPQQRLLLEVSWEALERAGITAEELFGSNAGVFVGFANSDYLRMLLADRDQIDTYTTTGSLASIAAGRLSYFLGAQGPSLAVDTACSSSLVAAHLAVQSLRGRECDVALAGGVNLILAPDLTVNFSRSRMMAPDGRCKTFDAAADGYVRSEGCGIVVLKRLGDARAAGDRILAVIRGSAVNQDGRSGGLTAPNGPSQEHVIASSLRAAGAAPEDIDYVEAHGTGTLLGDPIEVGALGAALCRDRPADRPLRLGSVKTNIGHTEAAAGIAGLIKLVLMLQHGAIPPHLNLSELNPYIAAEGLPISVPTERTEWRSPGDRARTGGVSSFGLSGTNAHIIVGEAPPAADDDADGEDGDVARSRTSHVVTLSARSDEALLDMAARAQQMLEADGDLTLPDVAYATNVRRSHLERRLAIVAGDTAGAARQLEAFGSGARPVDDVETFVTSPAGIGGEGLAFLFTGHGAHYAGMGAQLYADEPVFAAAIDRCAELADPVLDHPLRDVLFGDGALLDGMDNAQPALFCLQYALTELWASWGVRPSIVAGHSAGEYVAAVVAGVLDLASGIELITARGRLMASLPDDGEMVALFTDEATVSAALEGRVDVGIAAVNGPDTTVISGRREAVAEVIAALDLDDDERRALNVSVAAHSPLVEPILDEFESIVARVTLSRPEIGLVSSMTGTFVVDEPTEAGYWRRHLRRPVRFADVFDTMREAGCRTFIEIGPHPTLLGLGRRNWPDTDATWAASMRRDTDEPGQIAAALATVHVGGVDVDWAAFHRHGGGRAPHHAPVELPTYPWQRQSYWSPAANAGGSATSAPLWRSAVEAARQQADQGPFDLRVDEYPHRWEVLDRLATGYIVAALREMGLFGQAGESHTVDELFRSGHFVEGYEHLAARWLGHLVEDGLLEQAGDEFRAPAPLPEIDLATRRDEALADFDGSEALVEYLARCGPQLATVVAGEESALNTLFPDGSYETVDFLYARWSVLRYFNGIMRAAASAAAAARPGAPIRFLEIGAGTGGTSASVLPALPAERTSYTFTDVTDFFLARAADRFAEHRFVQYGQLDIERDPHEQGYQPGSFDVIVAANVLHATQNLDETLVHVRSLLAPGGVLLLLEATSYPRWLDVTTGLIEGWQRFEDDWRSDVPLIDAGRWTDALQAAGFSDVASLPSPDSPAGALMHDVMIARAPGEEVAAATVAHPDDVSRAAGHVAAVAVPTAAETAERLAAAMPDERHDVYVDVVRAAVAHVLRVGDPETLHRDQPLLELGFDSLMAVDLRNVLRQALEIERKLPATLAFDHPTIAAIARYLDELLSGTTQAAEAAAEPADEPSAFAELPEDEVEAALLGKLAELES